MSQKNSVDRPWIIVVLLYSIVLSATVIFANVLDIATNYMKYTIINYTFWSFIIISYLVLLSVNILMLTPKRKLLYTRICIIIYAFQLLKFSLFGFNYDLIFGLEIYPYVSFTEDFKYGLAANLWDLKYTVFYSNIHIYKSFGLNLVALGLIFSYTRIQKLMKEGVISSNRRNPL